MGDVGGGEVVCVHLVGELGSGGVDEESWMRRTGAAPDDVGGLVIVPCCCGGKDVSTRGRGGEVRTYSVEALGGRVRGGGLVRRR